MYYSYLPRYSEVVGNLRVASRSLCHQDPRLFLFLHSPYLVSSCVFMPVAHVTGCGFRNHIHVKEGIRAPVTSLKYVPCIRKENHFPRRFLTSHGLEYHTAHLRHEEGRESKYLGFITRCCGKDIGEQGAENGFGLAKPRVCQSRHPKIHIHMYIRIVVSREEIELKSTGFWGHISSVQIPASLLC